jgi:hypothetical protein
LELKEKEIEGCLFSPQLLKSSFAHLKASANNFLVPETARGEYSSNKKYF